MLRNKFALSMVAALGLALPSLAHAQGYQGGYAAPPAAAGGSSSFVNNLFFETELDHGVVDGGFAGGTGWSPGLTIGLKLPTLYIGGSLAIERDEEDVPAGSAGTLVQTGTLLALEPVVEIPFLRSASGKVEGYFQGAAGYGHIWENVSPAAGMNPFPYTGTLGSGTDVFLLQGALGARYFIDPSFAVGSSVGLRFVDAEGPGSPNVSASGIGTFFGVHALLVL